MSRNNFSRKYAICILIVKCLIWYNVLCDDSYLKDAHVLDYEVIKASAENLQESKCSNDLQRYIEALSSQDVWAMIMFDSTVKFPFGLLYGNSYQLGNYDECISAIRTSENATDNFQGQYCLAEVGVPMNQTNQTMTDEDMFTNVTVRKSVRYHMKRMHWALCLPSSCSANETQTFVQDIFTSSMPNKPLKVVITPNDCYFKVEKPFTPGQITYCVFIVLFLLFVVASTSYHCMHVYKKQYRVGYTINRTQEEVTLVHEAILSFSLVKNIRKLIEIRAKNNDYNLDCICGIRTISMGFILSGHALTFLISAPALNNGFTEEAIKKVQNAIFLNNPLLVDTFLLVSGFLMCRLLLIEMEKQTGRVNIFAMYLGRYIRLTPAYIVVIGFYCTFLVDLGDGPLWKSRILKEQERCISSWWANLLYLNNYVNTDYLCMFQSWYLSVDTQLFLVAPLIVFPLWYYHLVGEILLAITCIGSVIIPFMITCSQNLDPTLMIYPEEINDLSSNFYFKNHYIKTHMRANAYFVGMLFGYVVHKMQLKNAKIPFIARVLLGILAIMSGVGAMFSIAIFYQDDYVYSAAEAALYAALHRLAWSYGIGWTILVCVTSNSYVNNFLSWKAWGPFSKLTYCSYLVNGIVELYSFAQTRTPRYLSVYSLGCETTAHIVMTLNLAFILCVLFESPIHNLEKVLLRRLKKKPSETFEVDESHERKESIEEKQQNSIEIS